MELKEIAREIIPERRWPQFEYAFDGGKRVRPLLMEAVCERLGKPFAPLRKAALGVEILHCSTLLHDDIIDVESSRREREPFYRKFSIRDAILHGDYFALLSIRMFQKEYPGLAGLVTDAVKSIIEGQMMESSGVSTLEEYFLYAKKKTGVLFELSASLPAAYHETEDSSASEFSREFGLAFQMHNDLKKSGERNSVLAFMSREQAEALLEEKKERLKGMEFIDPESLIKGIKARIR